MFEKEVIIDGNRVRYAEKKGGGETAFVFLHGWGSDYTVFSSLFGITDTMIAFDFPGCGGSSALQEVWDLARYADIARGVINKVVQGKKLVLVAHSFGGRVALKMLQQKARDDVERVLCIGVPFVGANAKKMQILQGCSRILSKVKPYVPERVTKRVSGVWHRIVGAEDYAALKDEIMKKTFHNILTEDMTKLAAVLKHYKTDFMWGEYDRAAPLSGAAAVAGECGAALHIIKGGDHFPFLGKTQKHFVETFKQVIGL